MHSHITHALSGLPAVALTAAAIAQDAIIVDFPDPAQFYQNTTFTETGDVGFIPSFDNDTLWSFSLTTGDLLDPDGLALTPPGTASDGFLFPGDKLAIPGWFPDQGIFVADVSDPANLAKLGVIDFSSSTNIQGQNIEIDDNGSVGYVASFPNDTLYSFNIETLKFQDPDGLVLPGNPDRIRLAGDRLAIVDTLNGNIIVADVSDPADLVLAGTIKLPKPATFGSNDNIEFADDGVTGFVSTNERVLHSFNVQTLELVDPDGLDFGTQLYGDDIALHEDIVACVWSRGLAFVDVSDPADLTLIADANFGGVVAPQGSATAGISSDGTSAAISVVYPDDLVYVFDIASGEQIAAPFSVDDQPNYLMIRENNDVAVVCSGADADNIWIISGLVGLVGDINGDGVVDVIDLLALLGDWGDCPPPPADCPADLNGDGVVDVLDLLILLGNWT